MPETFESAEAFRVYLKQLEADIEELNQRLGELRQKHAGKEGQAPESSSEELAQEVKEREERFERVNREAETLAKVRDRALSLMDTLDSQTYDQLEKAFVKWLGEMSSDRFREIELENELPKSFTTNGFALQFHQLSHGTKDLVALAWKFAVMEHFLCDRESFMVLDDPLVDMDPERRALASRTIEKFAENCQVLFLTCHPDHAGGFQKKQLVEI